MVAIRADQKKVYPKYLFAALRSSAVQERIRQMHVGTLIPHFKKGDFDKLPIPLPARSDQVFIGDVYFDLSARIDLNRHMSETLGAIAQALFKSWFVDFEPICAKAKGRDVGLPNTLADLFADSFEDSELGQLPSGWRVGRLDDVLVLQRGFDLPAPSRAHGSYPVIAASGPSGHHNEFRVRGPGVATGRSGVLGSVFFVHDDFWPLNTTLWVKEFKQSTPAYAFHLLRNLDFGIFNAGSAVPTLNRNHVHNLPTVIPPIELVHAFDRIVFPFMQRQRNNEQESESLAALRDALLIKLISGELRVNNAQCS